MINNADMKVTYIDPDRRQLYVCELAEGGYAAWTQKDANAPRRLYADGIAREGYATMREAREALDLYVSRKRDGMNWGRWEVYVNGEHIAWDEDFHRMKRNELAAPDPSLPPAAIVSLANIEYRIATHIQGACQNLLDVGRCLNEAKDAGLVAHGEWEAWVRRNTNMSERQAQKRMQAARNVHAGGALERLPISKIQAILALPEPEREPMAEKAVVEDMSLRELQEAVKREKERADQLAKINTKTSVRAARAEKELCNLKNDIPKLAEELACEYAEKIAQEVDQLRADVESAEARAESLRAKLEDREQAAPAAQISPEAQAEIDRLKAELAMAEEYAEHQAEARQQAQRDMLAMQSQAARGEASASMGFTTAELAGAVRAFVGSAGVMVHMGARLATIGALEREEYRQYIDMVATWVDGARQALGTILVEA